jgi:hypothetical protein
VTGILNNRKTAAIKADDIDASSQSIKEGMKSVVTSYKKNETALLRTHEDWNSTHNDYWMVWRLFNYL